MIIGCIAVPVLMIALFHAHLFTAFSFVPNDARFLQTVEKTFGQPSTIPEPKIATNVLAQERAKQVERLTKLAGRPEMASGAAESVHVIALGFEDIKPYGVETAAFTRQRVDPDGYRRLTLDMTQAQREAVVLVSDQPIRWSIAGLQAGSWPRVAFEGYAAFDIVDGQRGSLAGFRIAAFGATDAIMHAADPTDALELKRGGPGLLHTFCASVRTWSEYFALGPGAAGFTLLLNPTRVTPRAGVPLSDGDIAKNMTGSEILEMCKRLGPYDRMPFRP